MARTNQSSLKTKRWAAVRAFVAQRANFKCQHCFVWLGMTGDVDHIVPRSAIDQCGIGTYDPSNLQYLCTSCHSTKTNHERHAGKPKRGPKKPQRTDLPGRDKFLDAAGIQAT